MDWWICVYFATSSTPIKHFVSFVKWQLLCVRLRISDAVKSQNTLTSIQHSQKKWDTTYWNYDSLTILIFGFIDFIHFAKLAPGQSKLSMAWFKSLLCVCKKKNPYVSVCPGGHKLLRSSLRAQSKGFPKERFLSIVLTRIWKRKVSNDTQIQTETWRGDASLSLYTAFTGGVMVTAT